MPSKNNFSYLIGHNSVMLPLQLEQAREEEGLGMCLLGNSVAFGVGDGGKLSLVDVANYQHCSPAGLATL